MRILRNTYGPWTVFKLSIYTQHLSAGRSCLPLLSTSGGRDWSGRGTGCVLNVYGRISYKKEGCVAMFEKDVCGFCISVLKRQNRWRPPISVWGCRICAKLEENTHDFEMSHL